MACSISSHSSSAVMLLIFVIFYFSVSVETSFSGVHISVQPNIAGVSSLPHHDSCLTEAFQGISFRGIPCQKLQVALRYARNGILKQTLSFLFILASIYESKRKNNAHIQNHNQKQVALSLCGFKKQFFKKKLIEFVTENYFL